MRDLLQYENIRRLPPYLLQFVVDQHYEDYTFVDQAVWRYVMRQNVNFLKDVAHPSYVEGLKKTGISIEKIPDIFEMNEILSKIGWACVAVDGFIPPAAFMEFQAYNVLVIAAEMRQIQHIEYTPAPDIIHEAAGHAPIIADPEYAEYLRLFGEIGSKAISSAKDYELYEAIRHLSILKEQPSSTESEIHKAEMDLTEIQNNMDEPSEMAQLRNLHWWTVEYGLIGTLKNPKIYGAGLLSSIGESVTCMSDDVKKIPYSIEAAAQNFDITTRQPQLFITPAFGHLPEVLNEFAESMSLRKGGLTGIQRAIESKNVATCELSSGLQICGVFTEVIAGENNNPVFIKATGPVILCEKNQQLSGHGKDYHKDGYSTVVGNLKGIKIPLENMSFDELRSNGIATGKNVRLEFESGIVVDGFLVKIRKNDKGKTLLLTFDHCKAMHRGKLLFDPSWGTFDMAAGERIVAVYAGYADKSCVEKTYVSPVHTRRPPREAHIQKLYDLYGQIRNIRDGGKATEALKKIFDELKKNYPDDWLLTLEIYEILSSHRSAGNSSNGISEDVKQYLIKKTKNEHGGSSEYAKLIHDGMRLCEHN